MSRFGRGFGIVLVMLVVVAMLGGACGPRAVPSTPPPPAPSGNQLPVISSLTAAQTTIYPSGNVEIRCAASDADGDQLKFNWSCTGGNFSGAGPSVIWKAPPNYGTYTIKVTVEDGKDGTAQSSLDITVGANQSPIISSLTTNPSGVLYGGSTTITCIANDPDGDAVRYSWSASEGNITGVGDKVTWVAPNKGGSFNITVIVSDGKGGEATGNITVTVSSAVNTVNITPIAQETGTVSSAGDKDNSRTKAGDDENDISYCAFWSFDIWSLQGKKIQSASLKFNMRSMAGAPFPSTTGLGGLWLWKVTYGDTLPKSRYLGSPLKNTALQTMPPSAIDVTPEIGFLAAAAATRFQLEAVFNKVTNGNRAAEWIEWSEVVLEVTYSEK